MAKISKEMKRKRHNNQRISRVINEMKNNGNIKMAMYQRRMASIIMAWYQWHASFARSAPRALRVSRSARARAYRAHANGFAQPRCRQTWKKWQRNEKRKANVNRSVNEKA
jgi:hypothetical protein